jgi:acyl-CoA thioesterase FadM
VGDFGSWPNVLAHVSIDYRSEVRFGVRELVVRTRVADVGRSSVHFEQSVLTPDGEVAAEAKAVLVAWDAEARRSRPITDADRQALREA